MAKRINKTNELIDQIDKKITEAKIPNVLSVLPLRDTVLFPNMIFPVLIGRTTSLKAVAESIDRDKLVFVSTQKDSTVDDPTINDIYQYGTIAKIIQILRLPNNLMKVLVEGVHHAKINKHIKTVKEYIEAEITTIPHFYDEKDVEMEALFRHSCELFNNYIKTNKSLPADLTAAFDNIEDPIRKLYFAASNVHQKIEIKQRILEKETIKEQYLELITVIQSELELLKLEDEIDLKVQNSIQKTQKNFYVQEQIRALQKELDTEAENNPELALIKESIEKADMPETVKEKALEEFERLKKTPNMSPEYSVNRTYLELLTSVPWKNRTDDNLDIDHVKMILDEDHYNLEKPKERIIEYIAVLNLVGTLRRQILCFVGPPGVGKTSLARSIARALGRKFVRFSLGGIRDEAEIRGHRRTYIGALPGKIIQSMKKAGTVNPVILLDEIDKMSMDFRGDPSSALLEVLDPEQNIAFNDHYLEVDYDLSNVLFITTANVKYEIPLPLQDRMEIIELSSYLDFEKLEIAKRHIIPKIMKEYGMENFKISLKDETILRLIREYTREAGVRNLEREVSSILRKIAKEIVRNYENTTRSNSDDAEEIKKALKDDPKFIEKMKKHKLEIKAKDVEKYLKAPKFKAKKDELDDKVGTATGLAWTSVGGDTLPVEVTIMPGTEKLTLTGKLGEVMKESAQAALSFVRSNAKELDIPEDFYKKKEIHIHVPEGAIPKDGPSAGITLAMALISAISGKKIRGDVAMTGEITLRGNILPIGGLNEKLLAARRSGIMTVIIPKENERDVEDINEIIIKDMKIVPVKHITEAYPVAFRNYNKQNGK